MISPAQSRAESLLSAQKRLLEAIANRVSLFEVLDDLCRTIDANVSGVISSVALMDPDGKRLWLGAGPQFPTKLKQVAFPWPIGPGRGACGTAAFLKQRVIISDITIDPRWPDDCRELPVSHGLRAAWSEPLISEDGAVLGTFAMYYGEPRVPDTSDLEMIEAAGHIAGIAIQMERSQAALRESEEWLRLAIQAGKMYAYEWDATADVLIRSPEYVNVLPATEPRTLTHQQAMEKIHPDDRPKFVAAVARHSRENPTVEVTYRMLFPGKSPIWVKSSGRAFFDEEGRMLRIVGIVADITDQKLAEEALRTSEERLRLAQKVAGVGTFEWDIRTGVNTWTEEMESMYGLPPGVFERTRTAFENLVHPDDRAEVTKLVDKTLKTGHPTAGEWRVIWPDGSVHWIAGRWQALMGDSGEPSRVVGVNIDVTERKRAEDAVRESEMRYRRIVETTNEGVWLLDSNFYTSYVNQQMAEMLGYEPKEMIGRSVLDFYFPEDVERKKEVLSQRRQGLREQIEERLRRKDGSELWVRIAATPVFRDDGEFDGSFAMESDITQRKRAEETLRQSEEKFRSVFRDAGVGMIIVSPEGRFLAANRTFCESLGYTEEELREKTVESLTFHEDWPAFSRKLREALTEGRGFQNFEKRCLHKSGRIVYTDSSTSLIRDAEGAPQCFVGEVLDITKRKQAEEALSDMTRKLVEAQELERARIARELHDDINQRLAVLAIEVDRLRGRNDLPREVQGNLLELQKLTGDISSRVYALSHEMHSSTLDALGLARGMKAWCKEFGARQGMEINFKSNGLPKLSQDISLCLFRVVQEALQNATKHSSAKGIEVQLAENAGEIHVVVSDSGKGFDIEAARRNGGLGLTSMQERVRLIGGTLEIDSKPPAGTTIRVCVPFKVNRVQE